MDASPKASSDAAERSDASLEGSIGSQLILAVNLIMRPFLEEHGKRLDLSLAEWRMLKALAAEPERSGEEIARSLYTDRMTASRALRRLEAKGRAARRKDPADRKRNLWSLTEAGWVLFDELSPLAKQWQDEVLSPLSAGERAVLSEALDKVIKGLA